MVIFFVRVTAENSKDYDSFRGEFSMEQLTKIGFTSRLRLKKILKLCQSGLDDKKKQLDLIHGYIARDTDFDIDAWEDGLF